MVNDLHSINNSEIRCFLKSLLCYLLSVLIKVYLVFLDKKQMNDSKYEMCVQDVFLSFKGKVLIQALL